MKEKLLDKMKRRIHEKMIRRYKRIIRKYVQKLDKANYYSFMAYSWGVDEITDYHVIAERSYLDHHVFGTDVMWFDRKGAR